MPRSALKTNEFEQEDLSAKRASNLAGYLSIEQVMAAFDVSKQCVFNWCNRGRLHPIKVHRKLFFSPDEVEEERARYVLTRPKTAGRPRKSLPEVSKKMAEKKPMPSKAAVAVQPDVTTEDLLGELSSDATKMFIEGKGVRDVVIGLRISYDLAKSIYDDFKACGPEVHLTPNIVAMLRQRLNWVESPPTAEGLIKALTDHETYLNELVDRKPVAKPEKIVPAAAGMPSIVTEDGAKRSVPPVAEIDFGDEKT